MLRFREAKANDFAALDSIEPVQTRTAVKAAFKYIINLSNVSRVYIDDWNAEIFQVDGKWVTDKNQINKIFFERATHSRNSSLDPEIAKAVAETISKITVRKIENITRQVRSIDNEIQSYQSNINAKLRQLFELKAQEAAFSRQKKEVGIEALENVERLFNTHAVDLWEVGEEFISVICKTDTIIEHRDLANKINRKYNLGRLIFQISTGDMSVSVRRRDFGVNRWAYKSSCHPHYGGYLCYGGFDADRIKASKEFDFEALVGVLMRWKDTYDSKSALTSIVFFNHHPAFTEYLPGDLYHDKTDKEIAASAAGLYFAPPFTSQADAIKMYGPSFYTMSTDRYAFKEGGGPVEGVRYERTCPAEQPRYMAAMPPLNEEEYREWLEREGHYPGEHDGWFPPSPDCGTDTSLRWSSFEEDYVYEDDWSPEDDGDRDEEF